MDCIIRKASPYRLAEFERCQRITIEDFSTWIASKEDLIISKLFWVKNSHSEIQLREAKNLASTRYDALEGMAGLTDTPPEIAEMVRAGLMALSGAERFLMGVPAFEAARRMPSLTPG